MTKRKPPEAMAMTKDLYGPNGWEIAKWIDSLTQPQFAYKLPPLYLLRPVLDSTREQTLNYVKANNRVAQMNRAIEDATEAISRWYKGLEDKDQKRYDVIVMLTEAMVVADCWEV